jgi:hypothetical protein
MANFFKRLKNIFTGTPEKRENVSTLRPEQEGLYNQAVNAGMGPGAGGAFGNVADYYRNNLSDNPADFNAFAAPALRQYNQDIVPGISEQFAGMGAGGSGLSGSGFQNAQIQGATDLTERLAALRAGIRQSSAQGLQNIGQIGLQPYSQNMVTDPGTEGLFSQAAPLVGGALSAIGGPALGAVGAAAGNAATNWFNGRGNRVGAKTSWAGRNAPQASPNIGTPGGTGFQLPTFMQGQGRGY